MSGLFSSKTKSTSTQSTQVPQNYQNFLNMSLSRAATAGDAPFVAYQDPRIAQLSANERMGIQGAASNYGMYQPLVDLASMSSTNLAEKAGRAPTGTELGSFINPYANYVLGNSLDRLQEQSDINMTKIGSQAGMSGAFGGLRHGVLEGANLGELLKSARDLSASTYADAYDKGMGNWWKSQDSQRASIDTLLNTVGSGQRYNLGDVDQLMKTGLTERTRDQGQLDFNFGEFMREQEDPLTKASFMSTIAGNYPRDIFTKTTKTVSTTTDSPLKTIAGIGLAAAGIMSGNPAAALSMGAGAMATRPPTSILPQSYQPPDYGRIYAEGGLVKGYAEGGFLDGIRDGIRDWGDKRDMGMVKAGLSIAAGADPLEAMDAYKQHLALLQQSGYKGGGYVHGKVGKSKAELDKERYLDPFTRTMDKVDEEFLIKAQNEKFAKFNRDVDARQRAVNARRRGVEAMELNADKDLPTPEGDLNYFNRFREPLRQDVEPPPVDHGALDAWLDYQAIQNGTYDLSDFYKRKKELDAAEKAGKGEKYAEGGQIKKYAGRGPSLVQGGRGFGSNNDPLDPLTPPNFAPRDDGIDPETGARIAPKFARMDGLIVDVFNKGMFYNEADGKIANKRLSLNDGKGDPEKGSQAFGPQQWLVSTWNNYIKKASKEEREAYGLKPMNRDVLKKYRSGDKELEKILPTQEAMDFLYNNYYMKDSVATLKKHGLPVNNFNMYVMHQFGNTDKGAQVAKGIAENPKETMDSILTKINYPNLNKTIENNALKGLRAATYRQKKAAPFALVESKFWKDNPDEPRDAGVEYANWKGYDPKKTFTVQGAPTGVEQGLRVPLARGNFSPDGKDPVGATQEEVDAALRASRWKQWRADVEAAQPEIPRSNTVAMREAPADSRQAIPLRNKDILAKQQFEQGAVDPFDLFYNTSGQTPPIEGVIPYTPAPKRPKVIMSEEEIKELLAKDGVNTSIKGSLKGADERLKKVLGVLGVEDPEAYTFGGRGFNKGGRVQGFAGGGGPVMRDSLGNVIPEGPRPLSGRDYYYEQINKQRAAMGLPPIEDVTASSWEDVATGFDEYSKGARENARRIITRPDEPGASNASNTLDYITRGLATPIPMINDAVGQIGRGAANAMSFFFDPLDPSSKQKAAQGQPQGQQRETTVPKGVFSGSNFFDSTSDDVGAFYDELGSMVDADPLNAAVEAGDASAPMQGAVESGLKQDEDDIMLKQMMREQLQAMRDNKSPEQPTLFGLNVNMDLVKLGLGMLASDKNFGGALGEAGMGLIQDKEKEELRKSRENSEKLKDILDLRYKNAMMESMDPEVKRELARQKHQQDMQLERMKRAAKLEEIGLTGANFMARTLNLEQAKKMLERGPPYSEAEKSWAWSIGLTLPEEPPPPVIKH